MKEKALIKAVLDKNMPDFAEVRRRCLQNEPAGRGLPPRRVALAGALGCAAIAAGLSLYLSMTEPLKSRSADLNSIKTEEAGIMAESMAGEEESAALKEEAKEVGKTAGRPERIVINEVKAVTETKLAAEGREVSPAEAEAWGFDFMKRLQLPAELTKSYYQEVYTQDQDRRYTVLHDYQISYWDGENDGKSLRICFSSEFTPLRDCFYSADDQKESQIGDTPVIIYQHGGVYIAWFTCRGINFDIAAYHWSEREFLTMLHSIIGWTEN